VAEVSVLTPLPRPGELLDRYRVLAGIAHGGMAAVYAVRREGLVGFDKLLAMKVLLPHLASERRFVDMFLEEARVVAHLQHPNLAQVFDSGEHQGLPYLVMEFLHGKSLSQCQARAQELGRPLSPPFLHAVLSATATGLHAAHETRGTDGAALGIVHRDVSPQNIHVGYDGQVKVVDFGIAMAAGRLSTTRTGEVRGKLSFVAPEQLGQQRRLDRRTDLWALGVVAWEAYAGRRLFAKASDGQTIMAVLSEAVPPLGELAPSVPAQVARVVMRCLSREVSERPATADEVAQVFQAAIPPQAGASVAEEMEQLFALDRLSELAQLNGFDAPPKAQATPARSPPPPASEGARARASRRWLFVAVAVVGVAGLGLAGALVLQRQRAPEVPVSVAPQPRATEALPAPEVAVLPAPEVPARPVVSHPPRRPSRRAKSKASSTAPAAPSRAPAASPLLKSPYSSGGP
jgi:serine/threonine-protein kinase